MLLYVSPDWVVSGICGEAGRGGAGAQGGDSRQDRGHLQHKRALITSVSNFAPAIVLASTLTFPLQIRIVKALLFLCSGLCAVGTLNVLRGQHEQHYFTLEVQ
jgi:hypothetical protein